MLGQNTRRQAPGQREGHVPPEVARQGGVVQVPHDLCSEPSPLRDAQPRRAALPLAVKQTTPDDEGAPAGNVGPATAVLLGALDCPPVAVHRLPRRGGGALEYRAKEQIRTRALAQSLHKGRGEEPVVWVEDGLARSQGPLVKAEVGVGQSDESPCRPGVAAAAPRLLRRHLGGGWGTPGPCVAVAPRAQRRCFGGRWGACAAVAPCAWRHCIGGLCTPGPGARRPASARRPPHREELLLTPRFRVAGARSGARS